MVLTRHALRTLFFVFLYVMAMKTFLELMFMVLPTDLQPAALPWKRQEGGTEGRSNNASDESLLLMTSRNSSTPMKNREETWDKLRRWLLNVPVDFIRDNGGRRVFTAGRRHKESGRCWAIPHPWHLAVHNRNWQTLISSVKNKPSQVLYLYNAHYDDRQDEVVLRIPAMIDTGAPTITDLYCLLWYANATVEETKVFEYSKVYYVNTNHTDPAFLLNCPARRGDVPVAVSVVSLRDYDDYCKMPRNFVTVRHSTPENGKKKSFAVCTRGLLFTESSYTVRLIEWIELLGILGVDKIYLYYYDLAEEVLQTLEYYNRKGVVELIPWSMSAHHPRYSAMQTLTWQNQLGLQMRHDRITYNDCFYRNIHMYEYVAVLDVDEVMVPLKHNTWTDLLKELDTPSKNYTYFVFRNFYFMDGFLPRDEYESGHYDQTVPEYLHMSRHIIRSAEPTVGLYKSITKTSAGKTLYAHSPTACLGYCKSYHVSFKDEGYLAHYRKTCQGGVRDCTKYTEETVEDGVILRFKDALAGRVEQALRDLHFLNL